MAQNDSVIRTLCNNGKVLTQSAQIKEAAVLAASITTNDYGAFVAPVKCEIVSLKIVPDTVLTGAATDYITIKVINKGTAAAGTTALASKAFTNGVNAAAFVATSLGSVSVANREVAAGEVLVLEYVKAGSGFAMPALTLEITWRPV